MTSNMFSYRLTAPVTPRGRLFHLDQVVTRTGEVVVHARIDVGLLQIVTTFRAREGRDPRIAMAEAHRHAAAILDVVAGVAEDLDDRDDAELATMIPVVEAGPEEGTAVVRLRAASGEGEIAASAYFDLDELTAAMVR